MTRGKESSGVDCAGMRRRVSLIMAGLLLAVAFGTTRMMADPTNGSSGASSADPPIAEADGWVTFFFGVAGSTAGPYTFSGAEQINVTDGFLAGDQFAVFDGATLLGDTSSVPTGSGDGCSAPASCFVDPLYSHGSFLVGGGSHAITIEAIASPFGSGAAWLEIVPGSAPTPEPSSVLLMASGLVALLGFALKRKLARTRQGLR